MTHPILAIFVGLFALSTWALIHYAPNNEIGLADMVGALWTGGITIILAIVWLVLRFNR